MKKPLVIAISIISTVVVAASTLSVVLIVSSKGKKNEKVSEEFKPSLDVNTRCAIKVVGDYSNFEALEAEFDRFNEIYPNVTLSYRKYSNYVENLSTALQSEDGPNIFFTYAAWMAGNDAYANIIPHMEDLSDPSLKIDFDILRPGLINQADDKKIYMAPVFSRTYGALVNNDLFQKEGLNLPNNWNELLSVNAAFKEKGYTSPMKGYSKDNSGCWMNTVAYPLFVAALANNREMLKKANDLDQSAGEFMRDALTKVKKLVDDGIIDNTYCKDNMSDNYTKVLLEFLKGQTPMMICTGDTVSGARKREKESDPFKNNPFNYSFVPIPTTDQGGYFIDSPSVEFSVNKDCKNLDMTNEFMRFLFQKEEIKNLSSLKGLINPTKDAAFGAVYSAFQEVPAERTFSPESLGVKDPLAKQIRLASFKVINDGMSIDEAIANYGKF